MFGRKLNCECIVLPKMLNAADPVGAPKIMVSMSWNKFSITLHNKCITNDFPVPPEPITVRCNG